MIRTQQELADLVGRSRQRVSQWMRDRRWTFGGPPWPKSALPQIQRWIAHLAPNREPALSAATVAKIASMTQAEYEAHMAQFFVSPRDRERVKWRRLGYPSWSAYVDACSRGEA